MAERRMFAKTIIDSDAFIDMPVTARLLYYDLSMRADDEGFVNSPKKIMRMIGASEDDMRILLAKKFIISFDSGIIVIKHWKLHNYIRKDAFHETKYKEEKAFLTTDSNNAYTLLSQVRNENVTDSLQFCDENVTDSLQMCDKLDTGLLTQVRLGKDRIVKDNNIGEKSTRFIPPTLDEVKYYIQTNGYSVNAERFIDFYESKGWMVGKNKMRDWQAAVRTWNSKDKNEKKGRLDWLDDIQ